MNKTDDRVLEIIIMIISMVVIYTIVSIVSYMINGEMIKGVQWLYAWASAAAGYFLSKFIIKFVITGEK